MSSSKSKHFTIDIVIPAYTINEALEAMLVDCIKSYEGKGRIIVMEDGGTESQAVKELADHYFYNVNKGFTVNVNRCLALSNADYTMVVSSDTYFVSGNIRDLCTDKITSPKVENQEVDFAGCFFVVPKRLKDKYGLLNDTMHTYWSDIEYAERIKEDFEKIESVVIHHHMAQTVTPAGVEGKKQQDKDKIKYDLCQKK